MQAQAQQGKFNFGGVILAPDGAIKTPLTLSACVPGASSRRLPFPCALQHSIASRNILADALVDLFDAGTLNAEARIKIWTAGGITLLATVLMANPSFDTAVTGIADGLNVPWSDSMADGNGSAAEFWIVDRDETIVVTGTVSVSGDDMIFPQVEIAVNDIVKILTASYTAPP